MSDIDDNHFQKLLKTKIVKNLRILVVAIFAMFAIVSCDKNDIDHLEQEAINNTPKEKVTETPVGEATDISDALSHVSEGAEGRGANVLIFSDTADVTNKGWKLYNYKRAALLPGYRYNVVITPLTSGDPDIYIYGYDNESTGSKWRYIRHSFTTSIDLSHLWQRELKVTEELGVFAVYGYTGAKFKIEILREDVCGKEDCIGFNTPKVRYVKEGTQYLITDGYSRMLMAPNLAEAKKIVSTIRFYQLNRQCFVGRPQASFSYYTKSGNAPVGAMPGEDCISFNPNTIEVKKINNRWKIVDGNHWMFDFEEKKEEAEQTLCLILKHGFTKTCFIGRPNPSMQYLRK